MLRNEADIGRVYFNRTETVPGAEPGQWLLNGLVKCGVCGVDTNAHRMRGRNGSYRYNYCRNHGPIRAAGADRRCPERNFRAEALDDHVFGRIRTALLRPGTLLAGEQAVAARTPTSDDELISAELTRLDRKITAIDDERRRVADLYQAGLLALPEVQPP